MSEGSKPPATPNQSLIELQRIRLAVFMLSGTANLFLGAFLTGLGNDAATAAGALFVVVGLSQKAIGMWSWLGLQQYRH